jgi:hypothetical protein
MSKSLTAGFAWSAIVGIILGLIVLPDLNRSSVVVIQIVDEVLYFAPISCLHLYHIIQEVTL